MRRIAIAAAALFLLVASARAQCITSCGKERWDIKTGCDAGAAAIDLEFYIDTTVAEMRRLEPPDNIHRFEGRAAGVEDTLWVVDATLTMFKSESDKDYHLVLKDHGKSIIAEIPNPSCVIASSPFHDDVRDVRNCFSDYFGGKKSAKNLHERIRVLGVGFFDFIHGQTGVAPNGIELHPVLAIEFLEDGEKCGRQIID